MDADNTPRGVAFIAPSITPLIWNTPGVNPSFRSYTYDPENKVINTYQQYYLPLDQLLPGDDEYEEDQVKVWKKIFTNQRQKKIGEIDFFFLYISRNFCEIQDPRNYINFTIFLDTYIL